MKAVTFTPKRRKNVIYLKAENKVLREQNERMLAELISIRIAAQVMAEQAYKIINAVNEAMK